MTETILNNTLGRNDRREVDVPRRREGGGGQTDRQTNADYVTKKCIIRNAYQDDSAAGPLWIAGASYTWVWSSLTCVLFECVCSNSAQCQQTAT